MTFECRRVDVWAKVTGVVKFCSFKKTGMERELTYTHGIH
jgi:hypothetical protein